MPGAADAPPREPKDVIEHILERYHAVHRRELAELCPLARKVEGVHAAHPQRPVGIAALLTQMRAELEHHMMREEQMLFPTMLAGGGCTWWACTSPGTCRPGWSMARPRPAMRQSRSTRLPTRARFTSCWRARRTRSR
ncbi:MAG: hemerythrin domain-containing protein [Armatimonadetes bacterium]|nr:hemerythrin domain-containing protein [Armatimonadota bacterium]